jgi:hypothetical protein
MISLNIQAEDKDVEKLLGFIRTNFPHLETWEQRQMTERAAKWLSVMEESFFSQDSTINVLELDRDVHSPVL